MRTQRLKFATVLAISLLTLGTAHAAKPGVTSPPPPAAGVSVPSGKIVVIGYRKAPPVSAKAPAPKPAPVAQTSAAANNPRCC